MVYAYSNYDLKRTKKQQGLNKNCYFITKSNISYIKVGQTSKDFLVMEECISYFGMNIKEECST